ncbi:MAG: arylsulfatase regulator [Edaphobacter sp.]|nr:arylsulfatase regulator [Edaphobacter sp.]
MNVAAEQIQIASLISKRVQGHAAAGLEDVTLFGETADYMAGFKRLMDTCTRDEMDGPCESFPDFYRYAKILERIAEGIQSGAIK